MALKERGGKTLRKEIPRSRARKRRDHGGRTAKTRKGKAIPHSPPAKNLQTLQTFPLNPVRATIIGMLGGVRWRL